MPRRRPEQTPVVIPTNSLVASAARYPGKAARIYQPNQDWQKECYRHFRICGEARFAAMFFGRAVSRAVLEVTKPGSGVQKDGPGVDALHDLFNGKDGQAQMLEAIGIHLTIAGECYLVGRKVGGEDMWEIVSVLEMHVAGTNWTIKYGDGLPDVPLTESDVVIRIWQPNPARRIEADSPFRSLLPILSEIEWLTKHIFAQTSSRLAGAGILILPQSMTFPPPPEVDGKAPVTANEAEAFTLTLGNGMLAPIEDPSSPNALVPLVITVPDESVDKIKHLTFWSPLDEAALELRSEAIRRFALGMDLPPEQVLGMSSNGGTGGGTSNGVSHWGAWQIEEATIKMHIEPILELVCNAITMGYLRPITEDDQFVTYDTSTLRLRPDRSKEAMELWQMGKLTDEALLRENGFDETDLPNPAQQKVWLLMKIATASAVTPEQLNAALEQLGVSLGVVGGDQLDEARPAPSIADHPTRERTPDAAALLAACEALVFRALERGGNRLRQKMAAPPGVPAYETHLFVKANGTTAAVLADAWSCAPQVLEGLADPEKVIPVLDSYCSTLLSEQSPHSRERLSQFLTLVEEA